jgi:uncharacterized delta-60 repeat protein
MITRNITWRKKLSGVFIYLRFISKLLQMKVSLLLAFVLLFNGAALFSQTLDSNFGNGGKVTVTLGGDTQGFGALSVLPDGKIIACGAYEVSGSPYDYLVLVKYKTDGTEDLSFGVNGRVYTEVMHAQIYSNAIAVQSNGKIVVVGCKANGVSYDTYNYIVRRYNSDGTPDTEFAQNSIREIDMNNFGDTAYAVKILPNGKIVVAGTAANNTPGNELDEDFGIVMLLQDGSPDPAFGTGGKVLVAFGLHVDYPNFIELQADGNILIGGNTKASVDTPVDLAIVKLSPEGNLDSSFGNSGKVTLHLGTTNLMYAMRSLPDNTIVTTGLIYEPSGPLNNFTATYQGMMTKFNANGNPDTSFGVNGHVIFPTAIPNVRTITDVLPIGDKLLCSALYRQSASFEVRLMQFNANGSVDTAFGTDGSSSFVLGGTGGMINTIAIGLENEIVAAGRILSPAQSLLMRFNPLSLSTNDITKNEFSVYPNPFSNTLHLDFNLAESAVLSADLVDMNGRTITTFFEGLNFISGANTTTFPMPETLAKGMYFFRIFDGRNVSNIKIVK